MTASQPTPETYVQPGRGGFTPEQLAGRPLRFGDDDERLVRIRDAYAVAGTYKGAGRLTARQRDIVGVLRCAGEPLSLRELFFVFDGLERTWIDHSPEGLGQVLKELLARGLAERRPNFGRVGKEPRYLWTVPAEVQITERLAPRVGPQDLEGVGKATGRVYRWKAPPKREAHICVACGSRFHATGKPRVCSEVCGWILDDVEPENPYQRAMIGLARAQKKDRDRETAYGPTSGWQGTRSLDAPIQLKRVAHAEAKLGLHEHLPDTRNLDPAQMVEEAEIQDQLASILGELEIEDIARLSEFDLLHLQERLRDAELVHFKVTEQERRLWREEPRSKRRPGTKKSFMETADELGGCDLIGSDDRPAEDRQPWESRNQYRKRWKREQRREREREEQA